MSKNFFFVKDDLSNVITFSLLCYALKEYDADFELCSFYDFDRKYGTFWRENTIKYNKVFFIGFDVADKEYLDRKNNVFLCKTLYPKPDFKEAKVFFNDNNQNWVLDTFKSKVDFTSFHKELAKFAKPIDDFHSLSESVYKLYILYNEKHKGNERLKYFFRNYGLSGWMGFNKEDELFVNNKEKQIDEYISKLSLFELKSEKHYFISVSSCYYLDYVTIMLRDNFPDCNIFFIHNPKTDTIYLRRGKNSITDVSVFAKGYLNGDGNCFASSGKSTKMWEEKFIPNFKPIT